MVNGYALSTTDPQLMSTHPVHYWEWDNDSMKGAITCVIEKGMSIRDAAERHDVPKSTLGDRTTGRELPGIKSGCNISNIFNSRKWVAIQFSHGI